MTYKIDVKTKDAGILRGSATATITDTETKPPRVIDVITATSWAGRIAAHSKVSQLARERAELDRAERIAAVKARRGELIKKWNLPDW